MISEFEEKYPPEMNILYVDEKREIHQLKQKIEQEFLSIKSNEIYDTNLGLCIRNPILE